MPSSCCICLTQMLLSVEPLRLEQLPLPPTPPRVKLMAAPSAPPRRSWGSPSWLCILDKVDGWDRLSRLWWEWNCRMWRMDLAERASPAQSKRRNAVSYAVTAGNSFLLKCPAHALTFSHFVNLQKHSGRVIENYKSWSRANQFY